MSVELEESLEVRMLRHIQSDISLVKRKMLVIEEEVGEINSDLHRKVRPEYMRKLKAIQRQKGIRFGSMKEFDEYFSK